MTTEGKKARAQYLNGLAVAVLTGSVSAVVSGVVPAWLLVPAQNRLSASRQCRSFRSSLPRAES